MEDKKKKESIINVEEILKEKKRKKDELNFDEIMQAIESIGGPAPEKNKIKKEPVAEPKPQAKKTVAVPKTSQEPEKSEKPKKVVQAKTEAPKKSQEQPKENVEIAEPERPIAPKVQKNAGEAKIEPQAPKATKKAVETTVKEEKTATVDEKVKEESTEKPVKEDLKEKTTEDAKTSLTEEPSNDKEKEDTPAADVDIKEKKNKKNKKDKKKAKKETLNKDEEKKKLDTAKLKETIQKPKVWIPALVAVIVIVGLIVFLIAGNAGNKNAVTEIEVPDVEFSENWTPVDDEYEEFNYIVTAENNSGTEYYIRIDLGTGIGDKDEENEWIEDHLNDSWKMDGDYCYYTKPLAGGEQSAPMLDDAITDATFMLKDYETPVYLADTGYVEANGQGSAIEAFK